MFDLLKKGLLAGIGVMALTAEKVHEVTRSMVEEGKLSTEEAERLAEELIQSGEKQWEEVNSRIHEAVRKWSEKENIIKRKELEELKTRIEQLEGRVQKLEEAANREPVRE